MNKSSESSRTKSQNKRTDPAAGSSSADPAEPGGPSRSTPSRRGPAAPPLSSRIRLPDRLREDLGRRVYSVLLDYPSFQPVGSCAIIRFDRGPAWEKIPEQQRELACAIGEKIYLQARAESISERATYEQRLEEKRLAIHDRDVRIDELREQVHRNTSRIEDLESILLPLLPKP